MGLEKLLFLTMNMEQREQDLQGMIHINHKVVRRSSTLAICQLLAPRSQLKIQKKGYMVADSLGL